MKKLTISIDFDGVLNMATHPEMIYDTNNGYTLCEDCHQLKHRHKFVF